MTIKLSDSQLIVLSSAVARDDGAAPLPSKMSKGIAAKIGVSLIGRKLMREVRSKPGMPIWRQDEEGRPISLVVLKAGRDAIGVADEAVTSGAARTRTTRKSEGSPVAPSAVMDDAPVADAGSPAGQAATRASSKQSRVIAMLSAPNGTTLDDLIQATGWLPHTTRAALTGLRKKGFGIERQKSDGGTSVYRIVGTKAA